MRLTVIHALVGVLGIVGVACSSSVSGGGTGTHPDAGGGGDSGGGGGGMCSGTPQPLVGSCITTGANNSIIDCIEFTGSIFSTSSINSACSGTGLMSSTSPCPAMGQVAGHCIEHCGASDEDVVYYYTSSGLDSTGAQNACGMGGGHWVP